MTAQIIVFARERMVRRPFADVSDTDLRALITMHFARGNVDIVQRLVDETNRRFRARRVAT